MRIIIDTLAVVKIQAFMNQSKLIRWMKVKYMPIWALMDWKELGDFNENGEYIERVKT